ncbi:P22AR C-terminal domain-containing protein [Xenorhabdus bovienii]
MGKYGLNSKKLFQMVHHEFGVNHIDELTHDQLPSAIEYLATKVIEGELLPKEEFPALKANLQISDSDLQTLCWLWQHSVKMANYMSEIEPLLRVAKHELAGAYYTYPLNAIKCANNVRQILERVTEHIQIKPVQKDNWRILHNLRQESLPA